MNLEIPTTVEGFKELDEWIHSLRDRSLDTYVDAMRWYGKNSLYFLLRYILTLGTSAIHSEFGTPLYDHQVYIDFCAATEYHLKAGKGVASAARGLSKSEIRSCALPIQVLLNHPDAAIAIYSVEKSYGQKHMDRMKAELEKNELLKRLYPDELSLDPVRDSKDGGARWSNDGIIIKGRKMNRSVPSVEVNTFYGFGEIGSRYDLILLDDIETERHASTPRGVADIEQSFSAASSLLTPVALRPPAILIQNTRFSEISLVHRKAAEYKARDPKLVFEVPAEIVEPEHEWCEKYVYDHSLRGPMGGKVCWPFTEEILQQQWENKPVKREYARQFALTFKSMEDNALREEKINFFTETSEEMASRCNTYICIDPSLGVTDPMAAVVWGIPFDNRRVLLDGFAKKINPSEQRFFDEIFMLVAKWEKFSQGVVQVRIEAVGPAPWAELTRAELRKRGSLVPVVKVLASQRQMDGKYVTKKSDRNWSRWSPMLNRGAVWMPLPQSKGGRGIPFDMDGSGSYQCFIDHFLAMELRTFPACITDNILDAGGLIEDTRTNAESPLILGARPSLADDEDDEFDSGDSGWMSA